MLSSNRAVKLRITGIVFLLLTIIAKFQLRWIIHRYSFNDYGINGVLPDFFIVIGTGLIFISFFSKNHVLIICLTTLFGLADEFIQLFTPNVFDIYDIFAVLCGGLCTFLITGKFRDK